MKNTLSGYMTVEAALLMPMVWFSLFFVMFAGFFLYDRCIAEQDSKIIVMRASEERETDEAKVIRKVMEKGDLAGKKKLLFSNGVQKELYISDEKAKIKISGGVIKSFWTFSCRNVFKSSAKVLTCFPCLSRHSA